MERKAAERVQTLQSRVTLNNGVEMPIFGLGVYKSEGDTVPAVQAAIKNGYRLIDTAAFYFNEKEVGEAVRTCGVPREELFITTKLWNDKQREGRQREAFEASLKELGLEYVDLYLIHWPVPEKIHETWKILEGLYEEGIVKAILAGASAVEICSAFYQNSYALVGEYIHFLNLWMDRKGMENIPQFKGMLNVSDLNGVNTFERTQFMKYFSSKK